MANEKDAITFYVPGWQLVALRRAAKRLELSPGEVIVMVLDAVKDGCILSPVRAELERAAKVVRR